MRARLKAFIATPALRGSRNGNRITALRWAKRLRELGMRVEVKQAWNGEPCDLLIALHAVRSHASLMRHAAAYPTAPRVVAIAGTDLYTGHALADEALGSLESAARVLVLQPVAIRSLPPSFQERARVFWQSATAPARRIRLAPADAFEVVNVGHLRSVKDPLIAAQAVTLLPFRSRVIVYHLGAALEDEWAVRARAAEAASHGRWQWLGSRPRGEALSIVAAADAFVLTSVHEGGANAMTEAIACGVPILSTRIEGSMGILGADHLGYFPVGEATALAALFEKCATDAEFLVDLRRRSERLRVLLSPAEERRRWSELLDELGLARP
jgi:putative glycosyltransferase (TIGR04348 family)